MTKPARLGLLQTALQTALAPAHAVLHDIETAGGRRRDDAAATDTTSSRPLRVLLAEDNLVNQKVAQLMLAKLGHRVDTVSNGLEAVAAVSRAHYDVVLMDVQMPELDGLAATRRIRAEVPDDQQPRIAALTANVSADDSRACLLAGMDAHLIKPVKAPDLEALLTRLRLSGERRERDGAGLAPAVGD